MPVHALEAGDLAGKMRWEGAKRAVLILKLQKEFRGLFLVSNTYSVATIILGSGICQSRSFEHMHYPTGYISICNVATP
jgi:hypothetical protein